MTVGFLGKYQSKQEKKERDALESSVRSRSSFRLHVGRWPDHNYMSLQEAYKAFCERYDPRPIVIRK